MAGLSQGDPQASSGVVSRVSQTPPAPPRQAWAGCPLPHSLGVPVCWWSARKVGGVGPGQMVCAGPYLLGVGRRAGHAEPLPQSLLCLLAAGPQESALLPSFLARSLPSTTRRAPHTGTPRPLTSARSKPRPGVPRWDPAGVTRAAVPRGGAGEEQRACGIWAVADVPEPCLRRR